ncbi:hypothetical protein ACTXT7_012345, partial [Hymenolepis weldensis]
DSFVTDVTEADRSTIKLLLGEANAEVEEVVQDITPDDLVRSLFSLVTAAD